MRRDGIAVVQGPKFKFQSSNLRIQTSKVNGQGFGDVQVVSQLLGIAIYRIVNKCAGGKLRMVLNTCIHDQFRAPSSVLGHCVRLCCWT